jgi:arylsulfatase
LDRKIGIRAILRAHWVALLLFAVWPAPARAAETPKPPNIILITGDTLRLDHLGAYGNKRAVTPAIDRLASISVRFTRASTPFPRTTPALASLMTGLWPQHHGSREVSDPFTNGTTLPQILVKNGYLTFGVSANWVASRKQNMQQGFHGFISMKRMKTDDRGKYVTDRALKLALMADKDKPLFLWAHYMDPHFPYNPPKSFGGPPGTSCKKIMRAISKKKLRLSVVQGNRGGIGAKILPDCTQLYDAEIAYMDQQIGRLLRGLEGAGRLENVILVFAADHGEAFGEGGLFYEHGSTLHRAVMNVPLLITAPGVKPRVDEEIIRIEDLAPTILSLAGLPKSELPATDGVDQSWRLRPGPRPEGAQELIGLAESGSALLIGSFTEPFEGHRADHNCVHGPRYSLCTLKKKGTALYDREKDPQFTVDVSEQQPEHLAILRAARERWGLGEARQRAAWNRRYKLVEYPQLEGGYRRALYDLDADPAESANVIDAHPEVAAQLEAELRSWSASIPSDAPAPERDEEQLEMLRALGYVD